MFVALPCKAGMACILKKIPNVEISCAKTNHHGQRPCPTQPTMPTAGGGDQL